MMKAIFLISIFSFSQWVFSLAVDINNCPSHFHQKNALLKCTQLVDANKNLKFMIAPCDSFTSSEENLLNCLEISSKSNNIQHTIDLLTTCHDHASGDISLLYCLEKTISYVKSDAQLIKDCDEHTSNEVWFIQCLDYVGRFDIPRMLIPECDKRTKTDPQMLQCMLNLLGWARRNRL